jgi:hypothetical protein
MPSSKKKRSWHPAVRLLKVCPIVALFTICFATWISAYSPQPGDTLDIQILNKKDLNTRQLVAPDGTVSLPLVGRLSVKDKSLDAIDTLLKTEFGKYIQNPVLVVHVDPLKKTTPNTETNYYVSFVDPISGLVTVKSVQTISEAMAWTAGKDFQSYRYLPNGQRRALSPTENLLPGDTVVISPEQKEPIYILFQDQSKNTVDLKKAASPKEASAWISTGKCVLRKTSGPISLYAEMAGGVPEYEINIHNCLVDPANNGDTPTIAPGDTLIITIGKPEDWWGENWYKVLSGMGVVVGLWNSIK